MTDNHPTLAEVTSIFERVQASKPDFSALTPNAALVEVPREVYEARIMGLIAGGQFTVANAAEALGLHRATIRRRCVALGIDPKAARAAYLARLWEHVQRKQARLEKANSAKAEPHNG